MYAELLTALLCIAVTFYFWSRQHVARQLDVVGKIPAPSCSGGRERDAQAPAHEVDVIVVGGGAGGCAAAAAAVSCHASASVLLLESGPGVLGSMHDALAFSADFVASPVDWGARSTRVFAQGPSDGLPYLRGRTLGGTSSVDWGVHIPVPPMRASKAEECPQSAAAADFGVAFVDASPGSAAQHPHGHTNHAVVPVALAASQRSPISWAFAEACARKMRKVALGLDGLKDTLQVPGVRPLFQRVLPHGTRSLMHHALLSSHTAGARLLPLTQGLQVWCNAHVRKIVVVDGRVVGVEARDAATGASHVVRCRRGVVLAAGVLRTPRLLRPLFSGEKQLPIEAALIGKGFADAVVVPLIYQALPGISDDACNSRSLKNIIAWYVARKGAMLNAVCDTAFVADVPAPDGGSSNSGGRGAQVLVMLQPSGGFRHIAFKKLNIAPALGVFREAFTFHIMVHRYGDLPPGQTAAIGEVKVCDGSEGGSSNSSPSLLLATANTELADAQSCGQGASPVQASAERIAHILQHGIDLCRELVRAPPLAQLTTGREAVDCTLLHGLSFDKRVAYKLLYSQQQQQRRRSSQRRAEDRTVAEASLAEIAAVAQSKPYIRAYIAKHARLAGYGVGTASGVVTRVAPCARGPLGHAAAALGADGDAPRVTSLSGLFVGDLSAISATEANALGHAVAGSVAAAAAIGARAGAAVMQVQP